MNIAIVRIGHCFLLYILIAIRDVGDEEDKKRRFELLELAEAGDCWNACLLFSSIPA